jgi:hypothetical protein
VYYLATALSVIEPFLHGANTPQYPTTTYAWVFQMGYFLQYFIPNIEIFYIPIQAMHNSQPILIDLITLPIFGEELKTCSSSL